VILNFSIPDPPRIPDSGGKKHWIPDPDPQHFKTLVVNPFSCVKGGKKGGILGVGDSKLSASINDATGIKCSHIGVIPEVRKEFLSSLNFLLFSNFIYFYHSKTKI
jgi:hypothetical protein